MTNKVSSESLLRLSRREQQIMDIVYAKGCVSSKDVLQAISNPPSYSSIRALMQILVDKGLLKNRRVGLKYVFEPVVAVSQAQTSALSRILNSLFQNSPVSVVAALLDSKELSISQAELKELKELIAKKEAQTSSFEV